MTGYPWARQWWWFGCAATSVILSPPPALFAQPATGHQHSMAMPMSGAQQQPPAPMSSKNMPSMNTAFAGIPSSRDASGTAWQPDDTPMHAQHSMVGDWSLMAHYNVFAGYDHQSGFRGDEQFNSINWFMLMATRATGNDELMLRTMLSLEPWTATKRGYPLLFQSGEAYRGRPLVDRQHPHDLFMELAARYRHAFADRNALSLYVAPAGEPALGPPAFPHRLSAMDNPAAAISHHWLDSSHISFGVLTAGFVRDKWQLEGSWFNGREPDENRWDVEHPNLDSYSGRLTWNPTPSWSAQVSHGYLKSQEELHPSEHVRRTTASIMHLSKLSAGSRVATTIGWGRNDSSHADDAFLAEANYMSAQSSIFARAEYVEKTGEELGVMPDERRISVKQFSLGGTRELISGQPFQLAVGASVSYSIKPRDLDALYGERPIGYWIFLRLRPAAMGH